MNLLVSAVCHMPAPRGRRTSMRDLKPREPGFAATPFTISRIRPRYRCGRRQETQATIVLSIETVLGRVLVTTCPDHVP